MSTTAAPSPATTTYTADREPMLSALIVPPTGGKLFTAFGDQMVLKLGDAETGGALTLGFNTTPPGGGPPPHRHLAEDELFIMVSGREEYFFDGAWTAVEPGAVVYVPRGVVHTFRNVGDTPSQKWTLTTSGGFGRFFRECAGVFDTAAATQSPPDMGRILEIFAAYQIELAA
jgi:quercetin dioxygenase-like cupin family protein